MPKENIERAIKKGSGQLEGCNYEHVFYEGYGAAGTAVIIEALTDNKNRTVSALRHFFNKNGGNLAENGAVSWMFEHKALIEVAMGERSEDEVLETLMECEAADDIRFDEPGLASIYCPHKELDHVRKQAEDLGLEVKSAQIIWRAKDLVHLSDPTAEEKAIKFMDELEDLDDVQNVFANF